MPGSGGLHRVGTGAQRERVVALGVLASRRQLAHRDGLLLAVDGQHLVADAHIDVERLAQALGRLQQQAAAIGDHLADVVREPAVGERDVVPALENDDLGVLIEATGAGGNGCAGGNATDNDDLHEKCLPGLRQAAVPGIRPTRHLGRFHGMARCDTATRTKVPWC